MAQPRHLSIIPGRIRQWANFAFQATATAAWSLHRSLRDQAEDEWNIGYAPMSRQNLLPAPLTANFATKPACSSSWAPGLHSGASAAGLLVWGPAILPDQADRWLGFTPAAKNTQVLARDSSGEEGCQTPKLSGTTSVSPVARVAHDYSPRQQGLRRLPELKMGSTADAQLDWQLLYRAGASLPLVSSSYHWDLIIEPPLGHKAWFSAGFINVVLGNVYPSPLGKLKLQPGATPGRGALVIPPPPWCSAMSLQQLAW